MISPCLIFQSSKQVTHLLTYSHTQICVCECVRNWLCVCDWCVCVIGLCVGGNKDILYFGDIHNYFAFLPAWSQYR